MSVFSSVSAKLAGAYASVFPDKKDQSPVSGAAETIRDGIDILEAASLNRDHKHFRASSPEQLRTVFAVAAGCAAVGFIAPVIGKGLAISALSIASLEVAKLAAYRGLRVMMPFDPERMDKPREGGGFKNAVHNVLDFFEAVSLNRKHPWMEASDKGALGRTFGFAGTGIAAGVALTAGTVGLPALAGVALTEAGKFAGYRAYRIIAPYRDGFDPPSAA